MARNVQVIPLSERAFQDQVIELSQTLGWRHYHNLYAPGSDTGFPDLVLVHPERRVIFAELKGSTGNLSAEQAGWVQDLEDAGAEVYVWWPEHLDWAAEILSLTANEAWRAWVDERERRNWAGRTCLLM